MISVIRAFATTEAVCFEAGNISTYFDHMSTINRQYFLPSNGVSSTKSIIKCSNGLVGGWCAACWVNVTGLPMLCCAHIIQALQKCSATVVKLFVNHVCIISDIIPPFDIWSTPCVNLAKCWKKCFGRQSFESGPSQTPVLKVHPAFFHCCISCDVACVCIAITESGSENCSSVV